MNERAANGSLDGRVRTTALTVLAAGAAGSLGFFATRSSRTPPILIVLFVGWILGPFVLLAWAGAISRRWSALTRTTLYGAMVFVALGMVAIFAWDTWHPRASQPAFVYVLAPPVLFGLAVVAVAVAALVARGRRG